LINESVLNLVCFLDTFVDFINAYSFAEIYAESLGLSQCKIHHNGIKIKVNPAKIKYMIRQLNTLIMLVTIGPLKAMAIGTDNNPRLNAKFRSSIKSHSLVDL